MQLNARCKKVKAEPVIGGLCYRSWLCGIHFDYLVLKGYLFAFGSHNLTLHLQVVIDEIWTRFDRTKPLLHGLPLGLPLLDLAGGFLRMCLMLRPLAILRNDHVYLRQCVGEFARYLTFEIDSLLATIQLAAATLDSLPGLV